MIDLALIIAHVESNDDQYAIRFEPAKYPPQIDDPNISRIVNQIAAINRCTKPTASVIYASSWGKYQIMGFNLYSETLRLQVPVGQYLAESARQDVIFGSFIGGINGGWDGAKFDPYKGLAFARFYNGPGNPQGYFQRMQDVAAKLLGAST